MFIERQITSGLIHALNNHPVIAITGPRQCGKSTLAKHLLQKFSGHVYLDLERPSDLQKLENAEWFLSAYRERLICIDEIQRKPELFPLIRSLVDEWNRPGCFLILGSASPDLMRQSSESLAGRIIYKRLAPFIWSEVKPHSHLERLLSRGGFPRSLTASSDEVSYEWRENFVTTLLERDFLQWKGFSPLTMKRLWHMLAHLNGQMINYSYLGGALGITSPTAKAYLDLLVATYLAEYVPPFLTNTGKRLVKSPKVYITDSGITSFLLNVRNFNALMGHPVLGTIWEQLVLSHLKVWMPSTDIGFYRTSNGAEIDFVIKYKEHLYLIECKASKSPSLTRGNHSSIEDLKPSKTFIVAPVEAGWRVRDHIEVVSLDELSQIISSL